MSCSSAIRILFVFSQIVVSIILIRPNSKIYYSPRYSPTGKIKLNHTYFVVVPMNLQLSPQPARA